MRVRRRRAHFAEILPPEPEMPGPVVLQIDSFAYQAFPHHLHLEHRSRSVHSRSYSPWRTLQQFSGIGLTRLLQIAQNYDFAILCRQREDRRAQALDLFPLRKHF